MTATKEKEKTMSNLSIILLALGQKGGTIHDASKHIGVSVNSILNPVKLDSVQKLTGYAFWNEPSQTTRMNILKIGNPDLAVASVINAYHYRLANGATCRTAPKK